MKLLLVNDDGIGTSFLRLLADAALSRGHCVTVCAPSAQQSTMSHHYHTHSEVRAVPVDFPGASAAWALDGTPVDCVRIALRCLCPDTDAVFSGINLGYNTGWPVYASGTVGAAREAVLSGVPGFAVSAEPATPRDTLEHFASWAVALAERVVPSGEALAGVWNLNAPCVSRDALREPVMAPLHRGIYRDAYDARREGDALMFRLRGLDQPPPDPGSDLDLLHQGHITCTVLAPDAPPASPECARLLRAAPSKKFL